MSHRDHAPFLALSGLLALSVAAPLLLSGCASPTAEKPSPVELRVSAATSLKKVLETTAPAFETSSGADVVFNFGASGVLQKQIEGGAPADVFISASPKQVASLTVGGYVAEGASTTIAGNDLVVIVAAGNPARVTGPEDLKKLDRLVTGNPETAPHGTKAKEWLTGLGLWSSLEPRFVFAENAAQTVDYVARGEVAAGIAFASEAQDDDRVSVAYSVPRAEIAPVRYVAAPLADSKQAALADAYVRYLNSPEVQNALAEAGLLPSPEE